MLDSNQLSAVVGRHAPDFAIRRVVPIHEGWDSVVFEVNGEYMFRFPRREDVVAQYEMELKLLPFLSERLETPVPVPEFVGREDGGRLAFFGYRKLPGRPMLAAANTADLAAKLAHACAGFLSELHAIPRKDARVAELKNTDAAGVARETSGLLRATPR